MNPFVFAGIVAAVLAGGSARERPQVTVSSGAVLAMLAWGLLGPAWVYEIGKLVDALARGDLGDAGPALAFVVMLTIVLFPWPIARVVLVPRGRVKLAWAISRLSFWVWRRDVRGGAVIVASWAAARRAQLGRPPEPELVAWLERQIATVPKAEVRWRLGGAGIIAAGMLAEARGDRAAARRLIASAAELADSTWPRRAVAFGWEWLCAEAMNRGAWREVEFLARTAPVETRTLAFVGAAAARLTRIAPLPNDLLLRWRWLAAPRRLATQELLRRALATPATASEPGDGPHARVEPELPDGQPLLAALTLHAHALGREPRGLQRRDLARLARSWDAALADPELERRLAARAETLGGAAEPSALADLVREDLLGLIRAAGLELGALGDDSELLGRAARRLHGELLDGLEVTTVALESRVSARRTIPSLDEWQTFLALREQYAEAVAIGGLPLRRLAFGTVYGPVCGLAVWLWNERHERALGNAMFSRLLAEAIVVDDAEAIRLQERNVDCGV